MLKWDEFVEEFRNENDKIKPSEQFRGQLAAMVQQETASNIIPMRKRYKKFGTIAASIAVLVLGVCAYGITGNIKSDKGSGKNTYTDNMSVTAGAESSVSGTYNFSPQEDDEKLYKDFAGEYKQTKDALVSGGYLTIDETQEVRIRFSGAKEWTKSSSIKVTDQGKLQVECEYYHSEAEPDDIIVFTLEKQEDSMIMKIISSEFPLLQSGDEIQFSKY